MRIFIPSRGRPDNQRTAEALSEAGIPFKIVLAKNDDTLMAYRKRFGMLNLVVVGAESLAEKRQKILRVANSGSLVMVDDDLFFYRRNREGKFKKAGGTDLNRMFEWFESALRTHAHAGLVDKFMSQTRPRGVVYGGRYAGVLGYNPKLFPPEIEGFGPVKFSHEHDMHLQLLSHGLSPVISCEFSKDSTYYLPGGLSGYRTKATEKAEFLKLQSRWPEYVKLVSNKNTKSGVSARFNWRKAIKDGKEKRNG